MKFRQNKKYWISRGCEFSYYCISMNGQIRIYQHDEYNPNYKYDRVWIDGYFTDLKLLWKNVSSYRDSFCYLLLKESNGKGKIVELFSDKIVLERFQYNSYKSIRKRTIRNESSLEDKDDIVVKFLNKNTKYFALYSITEKFIFGPYNYTDIEEYQYGVRLDNKLIVENDGDITDISEYEYNGEIWYNKKENNYFLDLDEDGHVIFWFEQDDDDEDLFKFEVGDRLFIYNKKTEEVTRERIPNSESIDWSQYNDIAYEGYSRLELGLDD